MHQARIGVLLVVTLTWVVWTGLPKATMEPLAHSPRTGPELLGPLEPNDMLENVDLLRNERLLGPEDVDADEFGWVYSGLQDGTIRRLGSTPAGYVPKILENTGGRPMGLDFDSAGRLWLADSELGLLAISGEGGVSVRADRAGGIGINFANDVDVAPDGLVYFSDASTRFGAEDIHLEALEARPHGRLIRFDPETDNSEVLLDDLYFANGIAVSQNGSFVLVAETFRYRIRQFWLAGPRPGKNEIFIDNLPGFPDGVSSTERGTFWVAIYRPRSWMLDRVLHPRPWLKRLVAKLPRALLVDRSRYGLVLEIDSEGRILRSLHDPTGETLHSITSAEEFDGTLYMASVTGNTIGWLSLP